MTKSNGRKYSEGYANWYLNQLDKLNFLRLTERQERLLRKFRPNSFCKICGNHKSIPCLTHETIEVCKLCKMVIPAYSIHICKLSKHRNKILKMLKNQSRMRGN